LARRFAYVLKHQAKLRKGDCHVHLFAANSVEDVALRLASVMVGTVPVTVNWDSDPIDRVVFKVSFLIIMETSSRYTEWLAER
jgi:acyl-CoA synthetase (AMP-forming)/AMP-acid ligase II